MINNEKLEKIKKYFDENNHPYKLAGDEKILARCIMRCADDSMVLDFETEKYLCDKCKTTGSIDAFIHEEDDFRLQHTKSQEEIEKLENKNQPARKLVDSLLGSKIKLFTDQFGESYVAVNGDGSLIMKLESEEFKNYILKNIFDSNQKFHGRDTFKTAIDILNAKATEENDKRCLSVRATCDKNNNFWYDLGNGRVVSINKNGWEITSNPPILFRKFKHQLPQPDPIPEGYLSDFTKLLNINNDEISILLQIYIVSCFLGGFGHPVLVLYGQHGSAKSTLFKLMKELIDPSALKIMPPIKNGKDFIQTVSHHWITPLDNLTGIKNDLSDDICRACTGGGYSKRKLYSNDDDIIYDFKHIIGINGINNVVINADLLDRSILIELERIPENKRLTEAQINQEFDDLKPSLLGACLDLASKAIAIEPDIKIDKLFRMADFCRWGYAIAEAMGVGGNKFLKIYQKNIAKQNFEAIDASPIGLMIVELLKKNNGFIHEKPSFLLQNLNIIADEMNQELRRSEFWPRDVRWLWRKLNEIAPNLEASGIKISRGKDGDRFIKIIDVKNPNSQFFNV